MIKYFNIGNISIKPVITPYVKGGELWFEMVFFEIKEDVNELQPIFMCKLEKNTLKSIGQHFLNCTKTMEKIKIEKLFDDSHYKDFGIKIEKKENADYTG